MDIEFGRDDSMVRRIARARCAEHPDSAKNWHYRSVTGRLSLLSDSANSWHYRGTLRFGANAIASRLLNMAQIFNEYCVPIFEQGAI